MTKEFPIEAVDAHERVWQGIHDRATEILNQFGQKDYRGRADYWIVDDDWGWDVLQLEFQNLRMLRPHIIKLLQRTLVDHPGWMMTFRSSLRWRMLLEWGYLFTSTRPVTTSNESFCRKSFAT